MIKTKHIFRLPAVLVTAGFLFSCVNDLERIREIVSIENAPDESSASLHVVYTDSGYAKIELFATLAETYREQQKTKLKDGLQVNFFDENGIITSVLTAQYGEIDDNTGNMFVRDSVRLENKEKDKVLETEELFWNASGDSIYTDKPVEILSKDFIIYGIGARTTQTFDTAYIYKPKAKIRRNTK